MDARDGPVRGGGDTGRKCFDEGALDEIDHALTRLDAAVHRGGRLAVQDRAFVRHDGDRAIQAGIRSDVWIDERLDRVVDRRVEARPHDVHTRSDLGGVATEVEVHLVSGHRDHHFERQFVVELRRVEQVLEGVDAIRHGGDRGARSALGVVEEFTRDGSRLIRAVPFDEFEVPSASHPERRLLSVQISLALFGDLTVEQEDFEQLLLEHTFADEVHRGDPDRLLEDVGVPAVTEVRVMSERCRPRMHLTVHEDRLREDDVRQMRATPRVRIVPDEDVALADLIVIEAGTDPVDDAHERAQVHRGAALVLGDCAALCIEQARRAVAALLDVR